MNAKPTATSDLRAGDVLAPGSLGPWNTTDTITITAAPVRLDTAGYAPQYDIGYRVNLPAGPGPVTHGAARADSRFDVIGHDAAVAEQAAPAPAALEAPRTTTATIEALCAAGTILKLAAGHRYRVVAVIRCADLDRECPVHARGGLCVGAIELRHVDRPGYSAWMPTVHVDAADELTADRCQHDQECPAADHPGHATARAVAMHPEQGWTLLCNGVIVCEDGGELDPAGHVTGEHRGPARHDALTAA